MTLTPNQAETAKPTDTLPVSEAEEQFNWKQCLYHVTFIQDLPKNRPQQSLRELYLPLKTSDLVLVEYRKWLDKYGSLLPFYQGYETSHNIDKQSVGIGTRFSRHTTLKSVILVVKLIKSQSG